MNKLFKDAMVLTVITLVAGICLGIVYVITKDPIAQAQEAAVQEAYRSLFSDADTFEAYADFDADAAAKTADTDVPAGGVAGYVTEANVISDCNIAKDASGNDLGYIITVTSKSGYGGSITLSVGINAEGTVVGYSITDISETPGLGMKATEERFSSQFNDIEAAYREVTKSTAGANEIEAISGATITSRAVTYAVDAAIAYYLSIGGGAA